MKPAPRFSWLTLLALLLVLGCAAGARSWYLMVCADQGSQEPVFQVQGDARGPEFDQLVKNVSEHHRFDCTPPLAEKEETTAHRAPGYPWLLGVIDSVQPDSAAWVMRWVQCALGALTVGCYFFFARRCFHSTLIATLAGLLAAFYPFWIINTAEINDGVLTSFALSVALMFGARGSQNGGAISGLLFGAALAGLCMIRAALLPFAIVSVLWFLWRCRRFGLGWVAAVLCLIGFLNGLAPWGVRNYQLFHRPVPVVTTTYYHLWIGNNSLATGSALDDKTLRTTLSEDQFKELQQESNQTKRYDRLAHEVWQEVKTQPTRTLSRRIHAALAFLLGENWLIQHRFATARDEGDNVATQPEWLTTAQVDLILHATMVGLFFFALLGWRWSFAWNVYGRIGAIAAIWIPLPYVLSYAEVLSGPRLPLDGVLLCYAAYALVSFIPGLVHGPETGVPPAQQGKKT